MFAGFLVVLGCLRAFSNAIGEWVSTGVLGAAEESTKSVVRGWFATAGSYVDSFSAFVLSVTKRERWARARRRERAARSAVWQEWWNSPHGTFNALLEREGLAGAAAEAEAAPGSSNSSNAGNGSASSSDAAAAAVAKEPRGWFWRRSDLPPPPPRRPALQRGSVLFNSADAAYPLMQSEARRGLIEDARFGVELGIDKMFEWLRRGTRKAFFLERLPPPPVAQQADTPRRRHARRSGGGRRWEDLHMFTASDAILRAGYPLEEHTVTTSDGYLLQMHRIPRRGCREVAVFQHGVLDTALGWVAGGMGGSAALGAHDAGFDVWLLNTRANPPRVNTRYEKRGARYWHYSANELAFCDLPAQLDLIHDIKMLELGAPGTAAGAAVAQRGDGARGDGMRHSFSAEGLATSPAAAAAEPPASAGTGGPIEESELVGDGGRGDLRGTCAGRRSPAAAVSAASASPLRRALSERLASAAEAALPGRGTFSELDLVAPPPESSGGCALPYRMQAVGHSLGAACLLMYAVGQRLRGQPHRLRRLILLSPAGFHTHIPLAVRPCKYIFPVVLGGMRLFRPGAGMGLRVPSPALRWLTFKLMADVGRSPAVLELFKSSLRFATSGDTSQWHAAVALPHYAPQAMPAVSLHTAAHFAQWSRDGAFRFFDYGSAARNREHYGADRPPSVAEHYSLIADLPVDLAAGSSDGLITPGNVQEHAEHLEAAGVRVTMRGFDYGHLDFTFGVREEVVNFVVARLRQ